MSKDAFWFRHDSNASRDPKILMLRSIYGYEGYGIYWAIIEILRDQDSYKYPYSKKYGWALLAGIIGIDPEKLNTFLADCINEFGLLVHDESGLYSASLIERMKRWDSSKKNGRKGGRPPKKNPDKTQTITQLKPRQNLGETIKNKNKNKKIEELDVDKKDGELSAKEIFDNLFAKKSMDMEGYRMKYRSSSKPFEQAVQECILHYYSEGKFNYPLNYGHISAKVKLWLMRQPDFEQKRETPKHDYNGPGL